MSERGSAPSNETNTNTSGLYTLVVSAGTVTVLADDGNASTWNGARTLLVTGNTPDANVNILENTSIDGVGTALSETISDTLGIIVVQFMTSVDSGQTATIGATAGFSFVWNNAGDPTGKNTTTIQPGATQKEVLFVNVPAGMTTLSVTAAGSETCTAPTNVESIAGVVNTVTVDCR